MDETHAYFGGSGHLHKKQLAPEFTFSSTRNLPSPDKHCRRQDFFTMVHLSKLLILPLATFTTARSFCGAKTNAQILFQASKFAAEDAAEFSNQLDAAGTNFNDPSVAIRGGTASGLLKYINWIVPNSRWITIKTYVHVLASSTKYEDGYVSDKAILDQLVVLNKDYGTYDSTTP